LTDFATQAFWMLRHFRC